MLMPGRSLWRLTRPRCYVHDLICRDLPGMCDEPLESGPYDLHAGLSTRYWMARMREHLVTEIWSVHLHKELEASRLMAIVSRSWPQLLGSPYGVQHYEPSIGRSSAHQFARTSGTESTPSGTDETKIEVTKKSKAQGCHPNMYTSSSLRFEDTKKLIEF